MAFPLVGSKTLGVRSYLGTWVAPGGRVTFLGPTGVFEDTFTENNRVLTLQAALARCRAGKPDVIIVLPGHAENVDAADFGSNLVAGTQIVGVAPFGSSLMPNFTFTNAAGTILIDQAGVLVSGIKFTSGVDALANMVNISASGCRLSECLFDCGANSALDCDAPLIVSGGVNNVIEDCVLYSLGAAVHTQLLLLSGSSLHGLDVKNNLFSGQCATNGVVNITGTGAAMRIHHNQIFQLSSTSPVGIRHTDTALSAMIYDNRIAFITDVTVLTAAISAAGVATANVRSIENYACDEDSLGGVLAPTATGLE